MLTSCEATKVVLKSLDLVLNDVSIVNTSNYFFCYVPGEFVAEGSDGLQAARIHTVVE